MGVTRSTGEVLAPDLDHGADGLAWRARAREFARDVVGPVGEVLDQMEPAEVAAAGSPLFDLLAQAQREGLTRLGAPRRVGGVRLPAADALAVLEELAAADAALATLLLASPAPFRWAGALGGPALAREIAVPYFVADRTDWIGCSAVHAGPGAVRASPARDGWTL
jgi:alkylation response protein AidB-like acyl-CoA dehydrogenase